MAAGGRGLLNHSQASGMAEVRGGGCFTQTPRDIRVCLPAAESMMHKSSLTTSRPDMVPAIKALRLAREELPAWAVASARAFAVPLYTVRQQALSR